MNVIAVTAWRRPEFLKIYLKQLLKNKELPKYSVHFFVDVGYDPEIEDVINWFKELHNKVGTTYRSSRISACPAAYNILHSYIECLYADEFVIIGEEDIIPSEDFLRFCEYSYRNFLEPYEKIFCIAHKRRQDPQDGNPSYLMGDTQCTSPFLISKKAIEKYMVGVCSRIDFFSNPIAYNQIYYPNSRIPPHEHYDHDGQIERIIEANGLFALKPDQARTAHIGFYGGTNLPPKMATVDQRVKVIEEICFNQQKLSEESLIWDKRAVPTEVVTCQLSNYNWEHLYLDVDRVNCKSSSWWYDPENRFKRYITGK